VPSTQLTGCDLRPEFFALGYELFRDASSLKATFFPADVFASGTPLDDLNGKIDIIYVGSFLHLFTYDTQVRICKRLVNILRVEAGAMVVGRQVGATVAGEKISRTNMEERMWRHDEESFKRMWREVGEATGCVQFYPSLINSFLRKKKKAPLSLFLICHESLGIKVEPFSSNTSQRPKKKMHELPRISANKRIARNGESNRTFSSSRIGRSKTTRLITRGQN
jgi:hypothetical protein